jgi:hypothetical protein
MYVYKVKKLKKWPRPKICTVITLIQFSSIQFNSIQFVYVQNLIAQRPITNLAQARKWEE